MPACTVCLGSYSLRFLDGGAYMWMFLNWALGLRALGCRVLWLESVAPDASLRHEAQAAQVLASRLAEFGLDAHLSVVTTAGSALSLPGATASLDEVFAADLFVNLGYDLAPSFIGRFKRSAFVDIDPGLTQVWLASGDLAIPPHSIFFTYGETVGHPDSPIPTCGIEWHYTPPPVFLEAWCAAPAAADAPYTTVSSWWDPDAWLPHAGGHVDNSKRTAFLDYLDLPHSAAAPLELAISIGQGEDAEQDHALLRRHGWRVVNSAAVAGSPAAYRDYVRRSRGEFSCMRRGYALLRTAWAGERALNYLASGKPALIQWTGPSRFLPEDEGLLRFRDFGDARRCLDRLAAEYERHCTSARRIAEEFFDARRVLGRFLETALA